MKWESREFGTDLTRVMLIHNGKSRWFDNMCPEQLLVSLETYDWLWPYTKVISKKHVVCHTKTDFRQMCVDSRYWQSRMAAENVPKLDWTHSLERTPWIDCKYYRGCPYFRAVSQSKYHCFTEIFFIPLPENVACKWTALTWRGHVLLFSVHAVIPVVNDCFPVTTTGLENIFPLELPHWSLWQLSIILLYSHEAQLVWRQALFVLQVFPRTVHTRTRRCCPPLFLHQASCAHCCLPPWVGL